MSTLIAYFSASGNTARLAKTFAEVLGGSLYEIKPAEKYTSANLNWNDKNSRSTHEMNDKKSRPAIEGKLDGIEQDNIVLLFPIWWYEAPRIIQTFLESYDFSGKTIVIACTSSGSGLGNTEDILKKSCSDSTKWAGGKRFSPGAGAEEIKKWTDSLKVQW